MKASVYCGIQRRSFPYGGRPARLAQEYLRVSADAYFIPAGGPTPE
jgi:hypothetical protein